MGVGLLREPGGDFTYETGVKYVYKTHFTCCVWIEGLLVNDPGGGEGGTRPGSPRPCL